MQYVNGENWREIFEKSIGEDLGVTCFNPYKKPFVNQRKEDEETRTLLLDYMAKGDYQKVHDHMGLVRSDDLRLTDLVDFAVCHIYPSIASWGTAEEIVTLNREKKPIFVAVDGGVSKTPLWLMGTLKPHYFYNSVDEIIQMLKKIDSGEKTIDSERWRLLRKEFR